MTTVHPDYVALLEYYYAQKLPDKEQPTVEAMRDISSGWESVLYSFWLEHGPATGRQREHHVLRLYMGVGAAEKARREFQAMGQLYRAGYPVPQVYALEEGQSPFGSPFILLEYIEGQELWSLMSKTPEAEWPPYLTLFCSLFAQLHALDWRPFSQITTTPSPYHYIDRWLEFGRTLPQSNPVGEELQPVFAWLGTRREQMVCPRPSPVHQDFHPSNVLVRPDSSAVVIDWTNFSVSDSRFDLGWTLVLAYAYESASVRDAMLHTYEQVTGKSVEQIECFEVVACLRRLMDVSTSLSAGPEQLGMRVEASAAIQQQMPAHRRVYALLVKRTGLQLPSLDKLLTSTGNFN